MGANKCAIETEVLEVWVNNFFVQCDVTKVHNRV